MPMDKMEILTEQSTENLYQIEVRRRQIRGKKYHIKTYSEVTDTDYLLPEIAKLETEKTELIEKYKDQLNELLILTESL